MKVLNSGVFFFAAVLVAFTGAAQVGGIPQYDSSKISYRGNIIEFSTGEMADTTMMTDETTGEEKMLITAKEPHPILLNGEKIYSQEELYEADTTEGIPIRMPVLGSTMLKEYLLNNMEKEIAQLADGDYLIAISNIITNKAGAVVYFKLDGITQTVTNESGVPFSVTIDEELKDRFEDKIGELLTDVPQYPPATYDGKPVNCIIDNIAFQKSFHVEDKKTIVR